MNQNQHSITTEYGAFDILRFILASCVYIYHMGLLPWNEAGNLAVQVFFALSGWLIGGILIKTHSKDLTKFYFNRASRVWTPYIFAILCIYGLGLLHSTSHSVRWGEFLVYDLTFTHNWFSLYPNPELALNQMPLGGTGNHFWSLSVEEQFYLIAPLIITLSSWGKQITPWLFISIVTIGTQSQYGAICLGVTAAVYVEKHYSGQTPMQLRLSTLPLIACLGYLIYLYPSNYPLYSPVIGLLIVIVFSVPCARTKLTRWLGGISYPLYLNAWIGTFLWHALARKYLLQETWLTSSLEFLIGVIVATVLYFTIDNPLSNLKNKLYTSTRGKAITVIAYSLMGLGITIGLKNNM